MFYSAFIEEEFMALPVIIAICIFVVGFPIAVILPYFLGKFPLRASIIVFVAGILIISIFTVCFRSVRFLLMMGAISVSVAVAFILISHFATEGIFSFAKWLGRNDRYELPKEKKRICKKCNAENPLGIRFCMKCGEKLDLSKFAENGE